MNLAALFFESAARNPARPALILPDVTLTYAELEERALAVRASLEPLADERVALLASRSVTAYAGVLGILAAGRCYVPLNPAFPAQRNRAILSKVRAKTIVVGPESARALAELLPLLSEPVRIVSLEALPIPGELSTRVSRHDLASSALGRGALPVAEQAPAYILFTSGSTGTPKGVVVTHRNVRRYLQNFCEHYPISAQDRLTQTFDLTFDLSVHDMFVCWTAGATLVVYASDALSSPLELTRQRDVSVWFSVPSLVAHLESARKLDAEGLPGLRLSLFCGEKLTYNAWQLWRRVAPNSRIVNLYGPTEATIAITHFEVPEAFAESEAPQGVIPIGRAFSGQTAIPRRADESATHVGEVGELWLAGDQLSAGYFEEPVLTAERFSSAAGLAAYRTGDRAALDAAADLSFFGREDGQVKIMGYRVELGEVEHALRSATGSVDAVALLLNRDGVEELVAVLPQSTRPRKTEIKGKLEALLPIYMRPRRYHFLAQLPVNANGKVDRTALFRELSQPVAS